MRAHTHTRQELAKYFPVMRRRHVKCSLTDLPSFCAHFKSLFGGKSKNSEIGKWFLVKVTGSNIPRKVGWKKEMGQVKFKVKIDVVLF